MRETLSHRTVDWDEGSARLAIGALVHLVDPGTLADRFFQVDLEAFAPEAQAQPAVDRDQVVRHPYKREPGDEIAPPVIEEEGEPRRDERAGRDVMAEAVFASEQVEEL